MKFSAFSKIDCRVFFTVTCQLYLIQKVMLFCSTKRTKAETVCLETHNDPVSRSSHSFLFKMVLYYRHQ